MGAMMLTRDRILAERRAPLTVDELREQFDDKSTPTTLLALRLYVTWTMGPQPLRLAPVDEWCGWFRRVGYLHNGIRAGFLRPDEPRRLYRAATTDFARGMSWTRFPELAARYRRERGGYVYAVDADPSWVLARQTPGMVPQYGDEWVLEVPADAVVDRLDRT